jgi:hypothetical protein
VFAVIRLGRRGCLVLVNCPLLFRAILCCLPVKSVHDGRVFSARKADAVAMTVANGLDDLLLNAKTVPRSIGREGIEVSGG